MTEFKRIIPGTIDTDFPCIYNPDFDETVCHLYPMINNELISPNDIFWGFVNLMFFYLPVSFVVSSMIYVYVNKKYIESKQEDYKEPEKVEFKDKYPITKEDMEEVKDNDKEKSKERKEYCSIIEYVPDIGNVIMSYNQDKEGFNYWADRTIPHNKLNTVCRKYVISFNCIELYVKEDIEEEKVDEKEKEVDEKEKEEDENEEEKVEEEKVEEEKVEEEKQNSVFASFKNYKTEGNPNAKKDVAKKNNKETHGLVTKKINSFIYKGKINNFSMNSKANENDDNNESDNDNSSSDTGNWGVSISFADFKKMTGNN